MDVDVLRVPLATVDDGGGLDEARLRRHLDRLAALGPARVVVLEGVPGTFCEGLDLATLGRPSGRDEVSRALGMLCALLGRLDTLPVPVVALVDGPALGGGLGLAAAADFVVATPRARFGLPEALVGLVPAVVLPWVARRMGVVQARRLALTGATLSAEEAVRLGLADEVAAEPERALARHAEAIARLDPEAVAAVRALCVEVDRRDDYLARALAASIDRLDRSSTRRRVARLWEGRAPWHPTLESAPERGRVR